MVNMVISRCGVCIMKLLLSFVAVCAGLLLFPYVRTNDTNYRVNFNNLNVLNENIPVEDKFSTHVDTVSRGMTKHFAPHYGYIAEKIVDDTVDLSQYTKYYKHYAPERFIPTDSSTLVLSEVDNSVMYELMFNSFIRIGEVTIVAPIEHFTNIHRYGRIVGADIVVATATPVDSRGRHYHQSALFLRRVKGSKAPWEYKRSDFKVRETKGLYAGQWENVERKITIYSDHDVHAGFIEMASDKINRQFNTSLEWKSGDLQLLFNSDMKISHGMLGLYIDADKMPQLVVFRVNRFGYLDVLNARGDILETYKRKR